MPVRHNQVLNIIIYTLCIFKVNKSTRINVSLHRDVYVVFQMPSQCETLRPTGVLATVYILSIHITYRARNVFILVYIQRGHQRTIIYKCIIAPFPFACTRHRGICNGPQKVRQEYFPMMFLCPCERHHTHIHIYIYIHTHYTFACNVPAEISWTKVSPFGPFVSVSLHCLARAY